MVACVQPARPGPAGVSAPPTSAFVTALRRALGARLTSVVVATIDPDVLGHQELPPGARGALGEYAPARPAAPEPVDLADLLPLVCREVAGALGHADVASVGADRPFGELGLDSMTAVTIRNRIAAATGVALHTTVVFDHPTPRALAEHVAATASGARADLP
ncbi:acyl carrier protein, partial [Frankia sp. R82]|uniref:acyl carrier protein n=1 Tax=Frankia sp. R82 TaxID=2950553 RepID=UPI002043E06D